MKAIDLLSINAIRTLSADAIEKAQSGHPGIVMGAAPMAYELWTNHLIHNPENPNWINRDRFILSAGHGSMLLYSLLHLFGYGGLSIEDIQNFRQWGSKTPGHPEYGHTVGVEVTTGPLGAGLATSVGMAAAEEHLAAVFNKPEYPMIDHYTYVLVGDGCLMEGISSEACSLAGTWQLDKLIVLYDSNQTSIEGSTDITFREDVCKRFEAFGFQILRVEDGNDTDAIGEAIEKAKSNTKQPSFIHITTQIGYGCPKKQGKSSSHGEPLGAENVIATKANLKWTYENDFHVPEEVYEHVRAKAQCGVTEEEKWNALLEAYQKEYPDMAERWTLYFGKSDKEYLIDDEEIWQYHEQPNATRNTSGELINRLKGRIPNLIGGAADLAPSTKTYMNGEGDFSAEDYLGRNFHFGVREMAMAAIGNGLYLHGGLHTFVSTFFVFSDYLKPMARLSALMEIPQIYILTHDSIGVGEDGPTHEPVEHLVMFRSIPNFVTFRPADATETAAGWCYAINSKRTPVALVLSRQNLPQQENSSKEAMKGGYILIDSNKEVPDAIFIACGSEVQIAVEARQILLNEGIDVRVVSMPSQEIFDYQSKAYRESVLPRTVSKRVAIEASAAYGWHKYVGIDGEVVAMNSFGASAPGHILYEKFGITVENAVNTMKKVCGE